MMLFVVLILSVTYKYIGVMGFIMHLHLQVRENYYNVSINNTVVYNNQKRPPSK